MIGSVRALALGALALAATGCSSEPAYRSVATIQQIMETSVEPTSNAVFDAAAWVNGVQVGGPKTDDDWKLVQANALMLAETGNLLLMGPRMKDQTGWVICTTTCASGACARTRRSGA